ncbi:MAG TPA: radical SAM protein [bacterium]|nr:radical SAM protein [bacterium]
MMEPNKSRAARVLLINGNRMKPPVGPLGLELVAEALGRRGIACSILDLSWENSAAAVGRAVEQSRPSIIGLTVRNLDDCYYASRAFLLPPLRNIVRAIKEATDAPVVLGGVGFSIAPEATLAYLGADYGLSGDGEESFPRLCEMIAAGKTPDGIEGLVRPGEKAPPPAAIALKHVAAPVRDTLDLPRYFRMGGQGNIETQRGCNKKCIYCADPLAKGRSIRFREPESVAEEIARLARQGVSAIHLCDPEFNLSRRHAEAVCRAIIRAGLSGKIKWYTYALPDPMDPDLASLMAASGCAGIDFSVDSASAAMLHALGREFGPDALETCARACRQAGIVFMYDLLIGGPGETGKTMAQTVKRMKRLRPDRVGVSFGVRVFAGTALGAMVSAAGPMDQNPALHGAVRHNDALLKPVFFVSEKLGPDPETYLASLISDDPIFLFASRKQLAANYNYNNNRPLGQAIKKGARGAYWDILRREAG